MSRISPPILTLDGPSGSGKGTVSIKLASQLKWHLLPSGLIYRALAIAVKDNKLAITDEKDIALLALKLKLAFNFDELATIVLLNGKNITPFIYSEEVGTVASLISSYPLVRAALLERQRQFCSFPGLVAEGRDMGTIVFPEAAYKVYLTAQPEIRAERRYKQLKEEGKDVRLERILAETKARDARDENRSLAPLVKADDALSIDSTNIGVKEVVEQILIHFKLNHE